ncbi:hypothetical protein MBLNU459_g6508t1 [Dothideomycetes sp. NU459]
MAEPQPSNVREGDQAPESVPSSAEDRKQEAAMSSLDAKAETTTTKADKDALGKAMQNLGGGDASGPKEGKPVEQKKAVKVDLADVTLLVEHLDVNKQKATELLRAHDADAVKAMTAWLAAP